MCRQGEDGGWGGTRGAEEPGQHNMIAGNICHGPFPVNTISVVSLPHRLAWDGPFGSPVSGGSHFICLSTAWE